MNELIKERLIKIENAISKSLPESTDNTWESVAFGTLPKAVTFQHIQNLTIPNSSLIKLGGKRWRPLLMTLIFDLTKSERTTLSENQIISLTPLVEFVHTASLIHDDIEDNADFRRGQPSAYITYGLDTALNSASWLYFTAPVCIESAKIDDRLKLALMQFYTKELRRLHLGQAMDIYWHRNPEIFPTIQEYNAMVRCKTGTLASLAAETGALAAGCNQDEYEEIGNICAEIGKGFQIIDDVINLTSGNPGKKRGDDIVEGKKSLPVLLHIQENPENRHQISELMSKASKEGIESTAVEECIALLNTNDCIKKASQQGISMIKEGCSKLDSIATKYSTNGTSAIIRELFMNMIPEPFRC